MKSKNYSVLSQSSAESKYRAIATVTLKLVLIRDLSKEIDFLSECPMRLYGDNKAILT